MRTGKTFYEIIERNAFDEVLQRADLNVKAVVNHDDTKLLGRTKSGTLHLSVDDTGLKYSIRMGNTQLHRDTLEMVERGDLAESSFKYIPADSYFKRGEKGELLHIVRKVKGLYDVSLVNDGAFANTDVSVRSALNQFLQDEETERISQIKEANTEKRNYITNLKRSINEA